MKYIDCLDKFDAPDIVNIAITTVLYEEVFAIFKMLKVNIPVIEVCVVVVCTCVRVMCICSVRM